MQIDPDHTALEGGDRGREATRVVRGNQSDSVSDAESSADADFSGVAGEGLLDSLVDELSSDTSVESATSVSTRCGVSTEAGAGSGATGADTSGVAGDELLGASVDVFSYEPAVSTGSCCTGASSTGVNTWATGAGADTSGVAGDIGASRAADGVVCVADTSGVVLLAGGVVTFVTGTPELETDGIFMGKNAWDSRSHWSTCACVGVEPFSLALAIFSKVSGWSDLYTTYVVLPSTDLNSSGVEYCSRSP